MTPTIADLKRSDIVIYRTGPNPTPEFGEFHSVTPSGKFVVVRNAGKEEVIQTSSFHILEIIPLATFEKPIRVYQEKNVEQEESPADDAPPTASLPPATT